ncbi:MAG TPA: DnaB-like helicase C-terminal domain-containing protein [Candidatus Baltobacteraceae bacterium]
MRSVTMRDLAAALVAASERRERSRVCGTPIGPALAGFSASLAGAVDDGVLPVGMSVFLGGAGAGKTAAASQIASTCGVPAMLISCEMRATAILERIVAREASVTMHALRDGTLSPREIRAHVDRVVADQPLLSIVDGGDLAIGVADIAERANAWRAAHHAEHILVVIDSIQSWAAVSLSGIDSEYERLDGAFRALRALANREQISLLVISERSLGSLTNGLPSAYGKGGTSSAYQSELSVCFAAGEYDTLRAVTPIVASIVKSRVGPQGFGFAMEFSGAYMRFADAERAARRAPNVIPIEHGGYEDKDLFG